MSYWPGQYALEMRRTTEALSKPVANGTVHYFAQPAWIQGPIDVIATTPGHRIYPLFTFESGWGGIT